GWVQRRPLPDHRGNDRDRRPSDPPRRFDQPAAAGRGRSEDLLSPEQQPRPRRQQQGTHRRSHPAARAVRQFADAARRCESRFGTLVQKTGRTTGWTTGRITAVNATVDVNYGGGRIARFHDQIITTNMSAPGDSGSLLLTWDNVAVGLLFAGSGVITIFNQIEN